MKHICLVLLCCLALHVSAQEAAFPAEQRIATGEQFDKTEFGGISSLTYDAARGVYYAISDDRAANGPVRYYTLALDLDADGFHGVTIQSMTEIRLEDDTVIPLNGADAEAIAYAPESDILFWASEGDDKGMPLIGEMGLDGRLIRTFTLPKAYLPGRGTGVVNNESFEALTLSADGTQIIAGTENALTQDGLLATLDQGSLSRLLVFDVASGDVVAEYVYETGPIPHAAVGSSTQDNGLAELRALDDHTLIALERSFAAGVGNTISVYLVDLTDATNIAPDDTLTGFEYVPVSKTLLMTLEEGDFGLDLDNLEGMTFGPEIDGLQTLVFVSDNNFNPDHQPFTQFLVFLVGIGAES